MNASSADRLLRAYVLREFREENPGTHKADCGQLRVIEFDSHDGSYGCETGCDWMTLQAWISCPHEDPEYYEYGTFGGISTLISYLEEMDRRGHY